MCDYELNKRCKKEITEHFDKLFKDPEFERMITKAMDEAPCCDGARFPSCVFGEIWRLILSDYSTAKSYSFY